MDNNIFKIIAEHLGVELNEEFLVDTYKAKFRITENNFERADYPCGNTTEWSSADRKIFFNLLQKNIEIKKLPWLPKIGECVYWYEGYDNLIHNSRAGFNQHDTKLLALLKLGLLFRTVEEARIFGEQRNNELIAEYENGTICKEVNHG